MIYFVPQPNNRMLIYDKSYSPKQLKFPDFKVSSIEYSIEDKQKITLMMTKNFFTGNKEEIKISKSVFNKVTKCQLFKTTNVLYEDLPVQRYDS